MCKDEKSTGLTFVKCPACRSLVPSTHNKCRMCGAYLTVPADKSAPVKSDGTDNA